MGTGDSPAQRACDAFVDELVRWRVNRGMSKKNLAAAMGFDPSYVSHVEARRHRPTADFARRAEAVLCADGTIWQRFREYDRLRASSRARARTVSRDPPVPEQWQPPGAGLIVEREIAELTYLDGEYACRVRRALYNAGREPVTRYLIRIAVDRYPGQPDLSNRHYRDHPLGWDELRLRANSDGEEMEWRPKSDRDAFKEVWLLFENAGGRFPLYPGQRAEIEYSYRVGVDKWGQWFQRAVRLPTHRLLVRLSFPVALRPVVWGVETSLSAEAEAVPLRTPIEQEVTGDRVVFSWRTDTPLLHARYRLEWRLRAQEEPAARVNEGPSQAGERPPRASDRMRAAGIVQRGAEVLRSPARRFDLPRQEFLARGVVTRLFTALDRVGSMHPFSKGMGLAAPQLNLSWAVAVVRPSDPDAQPIILLNPRVLEVSPRSDERYEGCLSFFDVRGMVSRPLWAEVESFLPDGSPVIKRYELGLARLVLHEIDHLDGRLYVDRMPPRAPLVPVEEYQETGRPWQY
ncbi:helix-turn-helix domain-containing protein [Planosporangium thailandense]|uniref:Peptide deformylase n=1 Tax=Planosporangium thailandense TaxID=765197 RepID=A0ABX0XTH4_9ACTN|nr:peptide deformylase [Planosporangium thailandense]NJC69116.1 helix-turn-helix domain-containing protein [Planosporangium thailandense]